jgi:hypothetical protein
MLSVWLSQCIVLRSCRSTLQSKPAEAEVHSLYTHSMTDAKLCVILLHALCLLTSSLQAAKTASVVLSRAHALEQQGFFASGNEGETNEQSFSRITHASPQAVRRLTSLHNCLEEALVIMLRTRAT